MLGLQYLELMGYCLILLHICQEGVLCYTDPVGLTDFSKIKQNLIFEIIKIVRSNGSEFAYPSTSVYVENTDPLDISEYSSDGLKSKDISHSAAPDKGDD